MVVVTWANYHYRDFVMNWVEHLAAAGCNAYIVGKRHRTSTFAAFSRLLTRLLWPALGTAGAMDEKLLNFLLDKGVPAFNMSSGLTLADFGWGTPTFHKMGREKINLIYTFTKLGFDVLLSDVDTVWLRNPVPYMQQVQSAGGPCLLACMLVTWYVTWCLHDAMCSIQTQTS